MKFDLGEFEFDLEDCKKLEVLLPFDVQGVDSSLNILLSLEQMDEDDLLHMYSCGDVLSKEGSGLAGSECDSSPNFKITLSISANDMSDEYIAVACQQHVMILVYQMLFLLGITLGRELGAMDFEDPNKEDEE